MFEVKRQIHFVGIGGAGMSTIAEVLLQAGHVISGSDLYPSAITARLAALGARIAYGHSDKNIGEANLVIVSSAIPQKNPEMQAARRRGIPILKRAEALGELTRRQQTIAVAGTHGKTTTSAMISLILEQGGLDPTILVGGEIIGLNAKLGHGAYLVAEADEFDGSFWQLSPWIAIVTNVEADHLDFYGHYNAVQSAFSRFLALVPTDGYGVLCWDDPILQTIAGSCHAEVVSYGFSEDACWRATDVHQNALGGNSFVLCKGGQNIGEIDLRLPGRHNVSNALAAITVSSLLKVDLSLIKKALVIFKGTRRRLELKGTVGGITIYDDYAHHPSEIVATLKAIRENHSSRLWVVFQPHTYHRTKCFLDQFAASFGLADVVIVTDIYLPPGREADTLGIGAPDLVAAMNHRGARYIGDLEEAASYVSHEAQAGDVILTMGAGDIYQVAERVLTDLRRQWEG
ncbi:MAG: UDP-N-acetylmuramate--L-alanine ligase [Chloroflexi bacterium]|nr:UDP-N-acetylmuramate--L-alanine ligase [Chloroflexota bacterium]MCL5075648.1 UDP-N-acetylmuramate--L-alanine ligase [Chloroflexota bacterium]